MANWGRWGPYRRRPPRRRPREAAGGIPARTKRGAIGETWWSARFIAVLESFTIGSRLQRGRSYARGGQVLGLEIEPGLVSARVQGSRRVPYDVHIRVKTLSARSWARLEKVLADRALFAARLLAGEMPHEIEETFATLGLSLFPARSTDLDTDCSCPDFANPCKHIAATFYILAEAFDDDPFLILTWRGRTRDELVSNLRKLRGEAAPADDIAEPHAVSEPGTAMAPLSASIDNFWRIDPTFDGLHVVPRASDTPDALLRQLGPPPPTAGGQHLLERLASVYRAMAEGAESLAFGEPADPAAAAEPGPRDETRAPTPRADGTSGTRRRRGSPPAAVTGGGVAARSGARFYVTDMQHFANADDVPLPPAARRLAAFFASIVKTATSITPGIEVRTPLKCRRRLGRSPCHGRLIVRLTEAPSAIDWRCGECGEAGVLRGWECSDHDLGGRDADPSTARVETTLSDADYELLATLDPVDISAEQLIRGAEYQPGAIRLVGTPQEFDALRAELSAAIQATRSAPKATQLRRLRRRLAHRSRDESSRKQTP